MEQEVSRRWPNFMVELEAQVQELLGVRRYVRGDGRLRTEGTNLDTKQCQPPKEKEG